MARFVVEIVPKNIRLKFKYFLFTLLGLALQSCFLFDKPKPPVEPPVVEKAVQFVNIPDSFPIQIGLVDEASGLVASRTIANGLWVHEDGNNQPDLFLISKEAKLLGKWRLPFTNRDWEDMAWAIDPINKKNYLYIADIGDNAVRYNEYFIYRFLEPTRLEDGIGGTERFRFQYTGGVNKSYNSEAIFVEPQSGDIYIVTKDGLNVSVFTISYPQSTTALNDAVFLGTIPYFNIVGGDISADGNELLLKSYPAIYFWKRKDNESIFQALSRRRDVSPAYEIEIQGEAIGFDKDQNGFFTLSERAEGPQVSLRFYGKVKADNN